MSKSYIEILKEKKKLDYYNTGCDLGVFQRLPKQEKLFSQGYTESITKDKK